MAEAAISTAVQILGDLLVEKVSFLCSVEEEVKLLKDELVRMQCFLKDAGEKQAEDARIRNWISDIRAVAHDAEDAVELFALKVDGPRSRRGMLAKLACFPKHLSRINKIGEEIASINTRLKAIQTSRVTYGILPVEILPGKRISVGVGEGRRVLSPLHEDKEAVGLNKDVDDLLLSKAVLSSGKKNRRLAFAGIVGKGGIGKSTLARLVYNHGKVAGKFDCRAWVVLSRDFRQEEIIRDLVRQLLRQERRWFRSGNTVRDELEEMEKLQLRGLQDKLHQKLKGKRYFIVLDDVWENAHWECLKDAFPNEDKASVLLLTSRRDDILRGSARSYLHRMKALDPNESWKLFLNKAFVDDIKGNCPNELESIGRQIVEKCEGLPLVITVAGGLLANRKTKSEWEEFLIGMKSHLNREGNNSPSAILELSYHNLTPQLKSCFLCLGFFKEDAVISAKRLLHIWIALGLIPHEGQGNLEDVARRYLDDLITRNVVQVKQMREDDRVKSLHMDGRLRDISISKSEEEIGFEILRGTGEAGTSRYPDKPRHRAVYCNIESRILKRNKRVRSLFYHGGDINHRATYWRSFELLRVLEFQDFGLKELPEAVCEVSGLRYLGLRNNLLTKLPSSLVRLKKLQVLDISRNPFIQVPKVVWKLVTLRHLYMFRINYVHLDDRLLHRLKHMTSLRKLGIELDKHTDVAKLCSSLALLENLVCLSLRHRGFKPLSLPIELYKLGHITQLKLHGAFTLPSEGGFPMNLKSLSLVGTWLGDDEDPMRVLEWLPKLSYLRLDCAYIGKKMAISRNGFSQLEVLAVNGLFELTEIKVLKGGMPRLRRLEINECSKLKTIPEKLRLISNFQAPS